MIKGKKVVNMNGKERSTEAREFQVHKNIIFDLVFKQSHSVSGALSELIMNSSDAGSTRIDLHITDSYFLLSDNGKGFKTKDEITKLFEVFGMPRESIDDNMFGRFRMGRGQIMGYAKTKWRSENYEMDVDIKKNGLNYELKEVFPLSNGGCSITGDWYKPIGDLAGSSFFHEKEEKTTLEKNRIALERVVNYLRQNFKFLVNTELFINDECVNQLKEQEWNYEDDVFMFKGSIDDDYTISEVQYFNLGVLAGSFKHSRISGVVISKKHMSLNMTRSKVQEDCKVMHHIKSTLKSLLPKFNAKLNCNEARSSKIIRGLILGDFPVSDVINLRLFPDYRKSKYFTLQELIDTEYQDHDVAVGTEKDYFSDSLYITTQHIILHPSCSYSIHSLVKNENKISSVQELNLGKVINTIAVLAGDLNLEKTIISDVLLSTIEKCQLKAVNGAYYKFISSYRTEKQRENKFFKVRKILVGQSSQSEAWTDCVKYIAIEHKYMKALDTGMSGAIKVVLLLIHEHCHSKSDDDHDFNFYRNFHNLCQRVDVGAIARDILLRYDNEISKSNKKPSQKLEKVFNSVRKGKKSKSLLAYEKYQASKQA